ncbi:MAG: acyl-CoA dehydrogenase family protein [Pseudomonadales bacterium]
MEFRFTDEQKMIRETAESFLQDVSNSEAVRKAMATEAGYDADLWQRICTELCFQAITIPEQHGGMGLGFVELAAVLEQMGRVLLCSPFFSTICLGVNALLVAGTEAQQAEYLPQIVEGTLTATLAYTGAAAARHGGNWGADAVTATYKKNGDNYTLNGALRYVIDGHTADLLIIAARAENSQGENGISLFAIPASTAGITRRWTPTMDQTRHQADITLQNISVAAAARMGDEGAAWTVLQKIISLAKVAVAAEQMGGAQEILDRTVAFTQERVQFGRSIASFQAIKHKAADMMLKCEVSRSAVYYAACVAQEALAADGDKTIATELHEAAAMAKSYCSDTFFFNAGSAIQLYGGVGFTWEYDVHLFFKRAKSSELFLGNGAQQRELIAQMLLD